MNCDSPQSRSADGSVSAFGYAAMNSFSSVDADEKFSMRKSATPSR